MDPVVERLLVVDIDDVGIDVLNAAHTPTLDRLTAEGRTFLQFHATGLCSPTRTQMHLGCHGSYPGVHCLTWISRLDPYGVPSTVVRPLGSVVSAAGLTTAKVGKWHLGPSNDLNHPASFGWQDYRGLLFNPDPGPFAYYRYRKFINGSPLDVDGRYLTTDQTNDGVAALRARNDLVSVSYHAIHRPYHVPPAALTTIQNPTTDVEKAMASLEALDHELGRLLGAAAEEGYTTLVFSDNGSVGPLRGRKNSTHQRGIRTRLWAVGPGVVPGRDDSLVSAVDLYATVLELLGVARLSGDGPDSISFAPQMQGGAGSRTAIYSELGPRNGFDARLDPDHWDRIARGDRYKFVVSRPGVGTAFFDLQQDPEEQNNLINGPLDQAQREELARLSQVVRSKVMR